MRDFILVKEQPDDPGSEDPIVAYSVLQDITKETKALPLTKAINMFRIGVQLRKRTLAVSLREFARRNNMRATELSAAKAVAAYYNDDEDAFIKEYHNRNANSWYDMLREVRAGQTKKGWKDILEKASQKVGDVILMLRDDPHNLNAVESLRKLRRKIDAHVPPDRQIFDRDYLKYYECSCCGEPPLADGHELVRHPLAQHLLYPICPDCEELNAPPDMGRIATMYASYAISIEKACDKMFL